MHKAGSKPSPLHTDLCTCTKDLHVLFGESINSQAQSSLGTVTVEVNLDRIIMIHSHHLLFQVDLREYYEKDGELLPSKKGIALDFPQWEKLCAAVPEIDAALQQQGGPSSSQSRAEPGGMHSC